MSKCQCKNIIIRRKGNVTSPKPSYPTTARPEQVNRVEAHKNDLKNDFVKIMEVLKEEIFFNPQRN